MKIDIKILLIVSIIILIFSMNGIASNESTSKSPYKSTSIRSSITNNESTIRIKNETIFSLKITSLGTDQNWGAKRILIDIMSKRSGRLTYIENYYSIDSEGKPKFYSDNRYENNLINEISFEILRPKTKLGKPYSLIKAIVRLDNKTLFEDFVTTGTFKLEDVNISTLPTPSIINTTKKNKTSPLFVPEDIKQLNNSNSRRQTSTSPIIIMTVIVMAGSIIYLNMSKNNKGKKQK